MPNKFHKDLSLDDIHAGVARLYADIAARDADTAFNTDAANINKQVRIDSPISFFILVSVGPAVWESLGGSLNDEWIELLDTPGAISPNLNVQGNSAGTALEFGQNLNITASPTFLSMILSGGVSNVSLDLTGSTGALRLNRLTTTERDALTALQGMTIFNTTTNQVEDFDGSNWVGALARDEWTELIDTPGSISANLNVQGNSGGSALEFGQNLTTTGGPTFGSAIITGALTVDTPTLVVDAINHRIGIGNTTEPLTPLTLFQGPPEDQGFTISGQGIVGSSFLTNGATIVMGSNTATGQVELNFTNAITLGLSFVAMLRFTLGTVTPNISGITYDYTTEPHIGLGSTNANVGVGFPIGVSQASIVSKLHVSTGLIGRIGLIVQGILGQTADLVQFHNNTGLVLLKFNQPGTLSLESNLGALRLNRLTTVERDSLGALQGFIIFNTTTVQVEEFNGTSWIAANAIGDVVGPAGATDNAVARFDTTTGKIIQNSLVMITDVGLVSIPTGGGLVVDGGTFVVDATANQVALGDTAAPLSDLTIFQSLNNTKGLTLSGQALFGDSDTDGVSIFLGANLVNNRQLFFSTFGSQGGTTAAFRFIFGSALPNVGGVTANGTTRMALTFGDETDGNSGFGFTLAAVQADIEAKVHIDTGITTKIGFIIQGRAGQTADMMQIRDGGDVILDEFDAAGQLAVGGANPNSRLDIRGSLSILRVATAVSINTDDETLIGVTDTTVGRTITIQTSDIVAGRLFIIKDESGAASNPNPITIATQAAETIDGVSSVQIKVPYGVVRLYSDGTNLFSW